VRCGDCQHENREGASFCDACGARLDGPTSGSFAIGDGVRRSDAPVPATIGAGRYRVLGLLGEGARKWVYRAIDTRLDREVAVAVVKTAALDEESRRRIEREARAMARLGDHALIVTVYDVADEDGRPYIVSQLMPGGSVADRLRDGDDGRLPIDDALRLGEQVAIALSHAHRHGVVHRDLKPANVWLTADGTAQLGDFGLAVPIDQTRLTEEGLVVGTVAYLAPEQALGHQPDGRADLYSLGAMLYEAVCGRPPFLGDDAVAVISQHLNTPPLAPSWHRGDIPPTFEHLIMSLLAKRPDERPASADEVVDAIRRIQDEPKLVSSDAAPGDDEQRALPTVGRVVGRTAELAQLRTTFDDVLSGHPRVTMVAGEPGIGKTRLVEELAVYAGLRRAQVLWGRCYEGEGGVPYLPFVEAFRSYVRGRTDVELREVLGSSAPEMSTLVSDIRARFGDLVPLPSLDPDAERLRLFDGIAAFIHNAAAQSPLVIVLDDLHWADKPSLLLLQYLVRHLDRDRVMLVGTYRDVELDRAHPLAEAVATLRRERTYDRVLLRGLSLDDVTDLLVAASNQAPPPEFAAMIHRETEGNPFFIAEILRHLVETGAIRREGDRWTGTPESVMENLPEGVREVIGRRLSHLSADCNALLTVAAAMPQGFSLDVARAVTGFEEDLALDLLDEALRQHVVQERRDGAGTLDFAHALIRQTLYNELSTPRRVRLHRQIAEALEKHYGAAVDAHLPELAFHCFQAAPGGDLGRAIDFCRRAAERASDQAAFEEAQRFYDMALQALDLSDDPDLRARFELLLSLGTTTSRAGDRASARAVLADAIVVARTLDDFDLLGQAVVERASMEAMGSNADPEVVGLLEEVLARAGDGAPGLRARVLERLATLFTFYDDARAQEYARAALRAADEAGDVAVRGRALMVWTTTLTRPEDEDEQGRTAAELARIADELGDLELVNAAVGSQLVEAMRNQDRALLDEWVERGEVLAERSRSVNHRINAAIHRANVATIDGDYVAADAAIADVLAIARRLGDRAIRNLVGVAFLPSARERGLLSMLEEPTRRAAGENPEPGWRAGLAQLLALLGKPDEAAAELDVLGAKGFENLPENVARPYTWAAAAEAATLVGATEHARALYPLVGRREGKGVLLGTAAFHGSTDRYLGLLARTIGELDASVAHLEGAERAHLAFRSPPWTARTRLDLARSLLARDCDGDHRRALALLNAALETAQQLGMTSLAEEVIAEKLTWQGVVATPASQSIDLVASAVTKERPDLSLHAGDDGTVTIAFSDIEGSTQLTERLGDVAMQELLRKHNDVIRRALRNHGGNEVKTQGDGFMLTFPDPERAARCALEIQRTMLEDVRVRIGLHAGTVIREAGDFFGRTVIMAARVASSASAGEILVSEAVRAVLEPRGFGFDPAQRVTLKGLSGDHEVSRLLLGPAE
jgi:class 3 adenylate cyclase/tetratricopeptide (TPR) repeat protein